MSQNSIMMNTNLSLLVAIISVLSFNGTVYAHPGRTASDGCHYCRTNCASWGEVTGQRHCHGGGESSYDVEQVLRSSVESAAQRMTSVAVVVRIVDGDTIEVSLDDVKEKVRIIGIDTPETVHPRKEVECFGSEASAKLKELIEGTGVQLQSNPAEDKDRYGRLLRYIEYKNEDIGARMIREGYAYSYKKYPHPRLDEYNQLEREAREANRGLWGSCENESQEAALSNSNEEFSDVKDSHPYMQAIRWGKTSRVLNGYPDGTFQPDKTVNRAEFLKIVLEGKGVDVASVTAPTKFTDVDENAWYAPYVRYAKAQGIIQGYGDGSFKPSQPVNFAEALKMAYVALGVESIETGGEWYERYLRHAKKNTVLFSDNVNVGEGMSRKDVVWIVYKMMNHTGDWE